ncbi:3-hydroxyacyl-CoA dehydrogenase family protein [Pseudodonghicola flavimaris]|uniref:3-hydroxyacyl-CoA dehydrogenase family protein n=1 Tax=Pseudodonghicola flavimaris TaxID=3050036 RepID=A0ABT7EWY7_9RHOB|nr:3-hydroxyacyl-CoA dehydrogenase family protein [Pseudodonghicola flavimaris]MDK3016855.1 3-hydroxyacyl-CoA dehydrogenase family protein [Pseudodonghicola flavimaris]
MGARALILGAGPGAVGLAQLLMRAGYAPELCEPDPDAARRLGDLLARAGVDLPLVTGTGDPEAAALAIEAMEEEAGATRQAHLQALLHRCDPAVPVLSTSLSHLPARAIGFRLAAPMQLRPLVEIAAGPIAPADQIGALFALARAMERRPVAAPVGRPSIASRLSARLAGTAEQLLMQGAIPHELDEAMVARGWDLGLFEAQDLIGLAASAAILPQSARPISSRMVAEGRLGKTAGVGWYRYPGGGGAVIDPLIEDLIREEAWFAEVPQRRWSGPEMLAHLLDALRREVSEMLADGTAASLAEVQTVCAAGLGFSGGLEVDPAEG